MRFLSFLYSEKDREARKRRSLELSLHRLEQKQFLLEMELTETKRQRDEVLKELHAKPIRHISTVSVTSADYSFSSDSSNPKASPTSVEPFRSLPINDMREDVQLYKQISSQISEQIKKEEQEYRALCEEHLERDKWMYHDIENPENAEESVKKY